MNTALNINGKKYKAKEMDFNFMCLLDDEGISLDEIDSKTVKFLRAYFTFCSGLSPEKAGEELNEHIISGGSLDSLVEIMFAAGEESGFLKALAGTATEKKRGKQKAAQAEEMP